MLCCLRMCVCMLCLHEDLGGLSDTHLHYCASAYGGKLERHQRAALALKTLLQVTQSTAAALSLSKLLEGKKGRKRESRERWGQREGA